MKKSFLQTNMHRIVRILFMFFCVFMIFSSIYIFVCADASKVEVKKFTAKTQNGYILVEWTPLSQKVYDRILLSVYNGNNEVVHKECSPNVGYYRFKNGNHGQLYTVRMEVINKHNESTLVLETNAIFLEFDKLPNIPLVQINTTFGKEPSFEEYVKPNENWLGLTIHNNDYVSASITIHSKSQYTIKQHGWIKVRGNTSAIAMEDKTSYKLNLDDSYRLLGKTGPSCEEWILLNNGSDIRTYVGDAIGEIVGIEWNMKMQFVNLMINGEWKGCYCLTPAVCRENSSKLVGENGCLFEWDAYWYKPNTVYFRTEECSPIVAFTIKHPSISGNNNDKMIDIQVFLQQFEDYLLLDDARYRDYIDEESFAKYLLAKDITGISDSVGSNMFYYITDFSNKQPGLSRIKMGPLWDFDSMCDIKDGWSKSRAAIYFPYLLQQRSFYDIYQKKWEEISPTFSKEIQTVLDELDSECGEALDESWKLEAEKRHVSISSFSEKKQQMITYYTSRAAWIDNELNIPANDSNAIDIRDYVVKKNAITYCVDYDYEENDIRKIGGWVFCTEMENANETYIGIKKGGVIYLVNRCKREDVKEVFGLDTDMVGFKGFFEAGNKLGNICIIDQEHKILYE